LQENDDFSLIFSKKVGKIFGTLNNIMYLCNVRNNKSQTIKK